MDDKVPIALMVIGCLGVVFCMVAAPLGFGTPVERENPTDPDRARFLLECQYDWMLSNEECRRLLEGGDPPEKPPEWTGC